MRPFAEQVGSLWPRKAWLCQWIRLVRIKQAETNAALFEHDPSKIALFRISGFV
jgi:hypothetical protein